MPKINWTIPAPVIIAIIGQAVALAFVVATWKTTIEKDMEKDRQTVQAQFTLTNARIAVLEQSAANSAVMSERVKGVEVNIETLKEQSVRIEGKLDKVIERRPR